MKRIFIALLLVVSLLAMTACGARNIAADNTPDVSGADLSATDASATDASATDTPVTPVIAAPEGYIGYEIGNLYLCYKDTYTAAETSATDVLTVYADKKTGANFSVTKGTAVDMNVSELSRTDLDAIGEKGAAALEKSYNAGVDAAYTYRSHNTVLDGAGVSFAFDINVSYTDIEMTQNYSYCQVYVCEGKDLYTLTFATNTYYDDAAEVYFADVIESLELKSAE